MQCQLGFFGLIGLNFSSVSRRNSNASTIGIPVKFTLGFSAQSLNVENHEAEVWNSFQQRKLGGGFKYFLFSPLFGEMIHFD